MTFFTVPAAGRALFTRLLLATAILFSPLASAQDDDDDMPDGDADLAEKPKKKEPKKEPRRETKKKEEPKKEEPKKEEPKKEEPRPEEPPKKREPEPVDDDDIFMPDDAPKKTEPKKAALVIDDSPIDDDDDLPPRAREPVRDGRGSLPTTRLDDDDLPSRTDRSVNIDGETPPAPTKVIERVIDDDDRPPVKSLDTSIEEPDESEGAPTGLIVGSAIGGALVVLAGAGVGGYFLVQALQGGGNGTVVITPR